MQVTTAWLATAILGALGRGAHRQDISCDDEIAKLTEVIRTNRTTRRG